MTDLENLTLRHRPDRLSPDGLGPDQLGPVEEADPLATVVAEDPLPDSPASGNGSRPGIVVVAAILVLLLGVAAAYYFWFRRPVVPELGAVPLLGPVENGAVAAAAAAPKPAPDFELPEMANSDSVLRSLVAGVSSHPRIAEWLVHDDLIRRFTAVVANVAFDENPAVHVPFLRPQGGFAARPAGEGWRADPAGSRRYAVLVEAFTSLDPAGTAELYWRFRPLIDQSYRDLGYLGSFDDVLRRSAQRLLDAPVAPAEFAVEPWIGSYRFTDPQLEDLTPAQKALVRMGPEHQRRVQGHLRQLLQAIENAAR